jgi:MFS family permease
MIDPDRGDPLTSKPPRWLQWRSSTRYICYSAFIATFTDGFLYGAIVPVIPFSLVDRTGVPEDTVQKWLTLFLVTFGLSMAIGAPVAGWGLGRLSSRNVPILIGLGVAFAATVLFWVGRAPWWLVIARALQGLSAPLINTTALALVADSVGRDQIGRW